MHSSIPLTMASVDSSWHSGGGLFVVKPVVIQQILEGSYGFKMAEAVISMPYKAVRYGGGGGRVYNLDEDPWETEDISEACMEFAENALAWMMRPDEIEKCLEAEKQQKQQQKLLKAWGRLKSPMSGQRLKSHPQPDRSLWNRVIDNMKLKKLWTDMHSNIHHEDMEQLPKWYEQVTSLMDFWPVAYYPFTMRDTEYGLKVEDRFSDEIIKKDWEYIREFTKQVNESGFPLFMGYEWQGSGEDGDHNVFFLQNDSEQVHPMRYTDLVKAYEGKDVIGIPHHIHMGPRTGVTSLERGLEMGYRIGLIASGDNHIVPAVFEHGCMCALAEGNTKEEIWDAFVNRRVYGVSQSRIEVDFTIDGAPMGSEVEVENTAVLEFDIKGSNAVDRVEILKDNILEEMAVHSGTWEREQVSGLIRFKFRVEFGWGPDTRVYPELYRKAWDGALKVDGSLIGIEKCWNNFGQELRDVTEDSCEFTLTTFKSTATGKWMGPSNATTEGFIFEVEADADSKIHFTVDGKEYHFEVRELLHNSTVTALWDEVKELTKQTFGPISHYRDDPWWHNAYKFKISRACPEVGYVFRYRKDLQVEEDCCYWLRIWQKNNDAAWTSPIFIKKKKA